MTPRLPALAFGLAFAAASLPAQDRVSLRDGSTLTGAVRRIESNGKVVVESPLAARPFRIRGHSLESISFESQPGPRRSHPQLLHLANHDVLPGATTRLDAESLTFDTWYAGAINISRSIVHSIDFGVTPQKLVFDGPGLLSDWKEHDDWELEDGRLVCDTGGAITKPRILPRQFILRFRIEWENSPNFRLYFCDDHLKRHGHADRYYFEVNAAGIQLKRETKDGGRRWFSLATSPRRPREFPNQAIDVEIRVDRDRRLLHLYLDGEKLGRYPDPIARFPNGSGIMLESRAGGDMRNIIPLIEIYEWDAVSQFRRSEGRGNPSLDAIVDTHGERYSGRILELIEKDGHPRIALESAFANDPLLVKIADISTVYFKESAELDNPRGSIHFDLRGGGKLRLSSLAMGADTLKARHPLLGDLELRRAALAQLRVAEPANKE